MFNSWGNKSSGKSLILGGVLLLAMNSASFARNNSGARPNNGPLAPGHADDTTDRTGQDYSAGGGGDSGPAPHKVTLNIRRPQPPSLSDKTTAECKKYNQMATDGPANVGDCEKKYSDAYNGAKTIADMLAACKSVDITDRATCFDDTGGKVDAAIVTKCTANQNPSVAAIAAQKKICDDDTSKLVKECATAKTNQDTASKDITKANDELKKANEALYDATKRKRAADTFIEANSCK